MLKPKKRASFQLSETIYSSLDSSLYFLTKSDQLRKKMKMLFKSYWKSPERSRTTGRHIFDCPNGREKNRMKILAGEGYMEEKPKNGTNFYAPPSFLPPDEGGFKIEIISKLNFRSVRPIQKFRNLEEACPISKTCKTEITQVISMERR